MNLFIKLALHIQSFVQLMIQTVVSCIKIMLLYKRCSPLPTSKYSTCIVLGNGPSLRNTLEESLPFLSQHELLCVNGFVFSDYFKILQPTNYMLFDPIFFSEEGIKRDNIKGIYDSLVSIVDWSMNLLVPVQAKKSAFFNAFLLQNKHIKAVYFNYIVLEGFNWFKHWAFKNNLGMIQSQSVVVAGLFLSINRGYKTIYLVGADTSWHEELSINNENLLILKDTNFYNTSVSSQKDIPLLHPENKNKISMYTQFMSTAKVFKGYENIYHYARYKSVVIYNASVKSYIDAFDRIKI